MSRNLICESDEYSFEVVVEGDPDLDGTFDAICLETGERLRINGWMFCITDVTEADIGGWSPSWEAQAEARQLGFGA